MTAYSSQGSTDSSRNIDDFIEVMLRESRDGILITDSRDRIIHASESFSALLGEETLEREKSDLFLFLRRLGSEVPDVWMEIKRRTRFDGSCRNFKIETKNGKNTRQIWINTSLIENSDPENEYAMLSIWKDVTSVKSVEKVTQWFEGEIESRVKKRTAQLEKFNATLKNEVSELRQAEERLGESLREKEVLLREVHHRVKNNMQVIISLLRLQSNRVKDKHVKEAFNESQGRIRAMALGHEVLYGSSSISEIDLGRYIERLKDILFQAFRVHTRNVDIKISTHGISLGIDQAIPCGLILNELISNSIKHAFSGMERGEICIIASSQNENIRIVVSDNGIGLPKNINYRDTQSLGLKLVLGLVESQLDGTLSLTKETGSHYIIQFKKRIP